MAKLKLCNCREHKCSAQQDVDPDTGERVTGLYLPYKTWASHNKAAYINPLPLSSQNPSRSPVVEGTNTIRDELKQNDKDLYNLLQTIDKGIEIFPKFSRLIFSEKPTSSVPYRRRTLGFASPFNGPAAMKEGMRENIGVLSFEQWLDNMHRTLHDIATDGAFSDMRQNCLDKIVEVHERLEIQKELEWERQSRASNLVTVQDDSNLAVVDTSVYMNPGWVKSDPLAMQCWLLVGILQLTFHASRDACRIVLFMLREIIHAVLDSIGPGTVSRKRDAIKISQDPETALAKFELEPHTSSYVCCPKCFALYIEIDLTGNKHEYPEKCWWKETKGSSVCGSRLRTSRNILGREHIYPIRRFLIQDIGHWLARLVSRPGVEDILDKALESQFRPPRAVKQDIWDSPVIRDLVGPDNQPFFRYRGPEGRYLFSVFYDNFNPFGNKTSGKMVDVGVLVMVCQNFPLELMFLKENVFIIGIVPGPNKPSLTQTNRLLAPIVDRLNQFWDPGVWFSQTHQFPTGRLMRSAAIPLVADTLAARQIAAFAAHNAIIFCIWCGLRGDEIDNIDPLTWPPIRSCAQHKQLAEAWLHAHNEDERAALFVEHGVRYSELQRLPYRDASLHTVFDTMHGFSGMIERVIREVWKVSMTDPSGDGRQKPQTDIHYTTHADSILKALESIEQRQLGRLTSCVKPVLLFLCEQQCIRRADGKAQLAKALFDHFTEFPDALTRALATVRGDADTITEGNFHGPHIPASSSSVPKGVVHVKKHDPPDPALVKEAEILLNETTGTLELRLAQKRWGVLSKLCFDRGIRVPDRNPTKRVLADCLVQWRKNFSSATQSRAPLTETLSKLSLRETTQNLRPPAEAISGTGSGRPVLGREVMAELDADAASMSLPSWIVKPPEHWGSIKRGKLKADEWRTVGFVALPVTLPRVWAGFSERHKRMLDNYMRMITAMRIGYSYTVSDADCAAFEREWFLFLREFKELYPTSSLVSFHHNIGHVPELMRRWGPTYSWRCFPFERIIGKTQRTPTDMKFGELEGTLLRRFCMDGNLHALLQDPRFPNSFRPLCERLARLFDSDTVDMFTKDALESMSQPPNPTTGLKLDENDLVSLSPSVSDLLLQFLNKSYSTSSSGGPYVSSRERARERISLDPDGWILHQIRHKTHTYRPAVALKSPTAATDVISPHPDSYVLIRDDSRLDSHPCCIQSIFAHRHRVPRRDSPVTECFLLVKRYKKLNPEDIKYDHWRQYGSAAGELFYDEFQSMPDVVRVDAIVSHFCRTAFPSTDVRTPIPGRSCVHVLPLDWHE